MLKCIKAMKTQKLLNIFDIKILEVQLLISYMLMKYMIVLGVLCVIILKKANFPSD